MMKTMTRRQFVKRTTFAAAISSMPFRPASSSASDSPKHPNIVFIAVEDFSPQRLGCYGGPVRSPNIDRLASEGVLFEKAYCMSPVCNASRTALLTGLRPDTTGIFGNGQDWRKILPGVTTMPMHFRRHGYDTIRIGKMFHGQWEHDASWTQIIPELHDPKAVRPKTKPVGPAKPAANKSRKDNLRWGPTGNDPQNDRDGQIAEQAIRFLKKAHGKPFFLGVGFHCPHLSFCAPDRFHEMYPPEKIRIPENPSDDLKDTPISGPHPDHQRLTADEWRQVISAHYAAISYTDWCIGKILDALEQTERDSDTIVIVWSDHGFMLGEHFLWRKVDLYEESARVAFIWKVPGLTPKGAHCGRVVESIDVFPTLFDLCNVPQPETIEGISMKRLLRDPAATWKKGAITWRAGRGDMVAIQTERYRLNKRLSDGFLELYDHQTDPGEFRNVAKDGRYRDAVEELTRLLDGGWKACLPPS